MDGKIHDFLERKCQVRQVMFLSSAELVSPELFQVARTEWVAQFQPFVLHAPGVEQVLAEVKPLILDL
jgi:hypothetical protein